MKFGILELMDMKSMSEEDKKRWEQLDELLGDSFDAKVKSFLTDEIKMEDFRKSIDDTVKEVDEFKKSLKGFTDQETFEKKMQEISDSLVRIKAATVVKSNGELGVKSVEDQLNDQLKNYISIEKKDGHEIQTLNLKEACMKSPGNKLQLNLVMNTKGTAATIASGSLAPHYGLEVDPVLSVDPRSQTIIRQYANVATTSSRSLVYAEYVSKDGDAAWVEEGALKPLMDATLTEKTVTARKVAIASKFTEETLSDFPNFVNEVKAEMINKLGIKEEKGILDGTGSDGEIKGVASDMPAFSLTSLKVESPNEFDALVAAYTQIVSVSEMAYRPNLVLMNPVDYAQMQLAKDSNGGYLRPFRIGDELIQGLQVVTSTAIAAGDFIMGDFGYLNIRDLWALSITVGWENDDFRKNIITTIAEKRLMCYIKSQYKTAFVKDKFKTVMEAIKPSVAA
jgi:HK97 family phage major capsid protein